MTTTAAQQFLQRTELRSRGRDIDERVRGFFKACRPDWSSTKDTERINLMMMNGGRWIVPERRLEQFYHTLLPQLIKAKSLFSLVEKPHPQGKLIFDVDSETVPVDTTVVGAVIAEAVHDVYQADDEPYWPTVYVSRSSALPDRKVHFIVPSCVATLPTRLTITLLIRERLILLGHRSAADCLDFKMTSLRIRYASKVSTTTKEYEPHKGYYSMWEVSYSASGEMTHGLGLLHFTALSFDLPVNVPTDRGAELLERVRKSAEQGPISRLNLKLREPRKKDSNHTDDEWDSLSSLEQAKVVDWIQTSPCLDPYRDQYKPRGWWHFNTYRLDKKRRGTPEPCPTDTSGTRHHDNQSAYIIVSRGLRKYQLQCQCRENPPVVLWVDPQEELQHDEDYWAADGSEPAPEVDSDVMSSDEDVWEHTVGGGAGRDKEDRMDSSGDQGPSLAESGKEEMKDSPVTPVPTPRVKPPMTRNKVIARLDRASSLLRRHETNGRIDHLLKHEDRDHVDD
jgi:hypothetical protein